MSEVVTIGDATLYHGDALEILPTLGKVDAVIKVIRVRKDDPSIFDRNVLDDVDEREIERLYYATRSGEIPQAVVPAIIELLANLYGRVA